MLLRSRLGASLQAIRDDEEAARSVGVRVLFGKGSSSSWRRSAAVLRARMWLASFPTFQPNRYFSVKWTAYMIFMVIVGGLGTFEGPIVGAIIFFVIQDRYGDQGVWYLVGLGAAAIVFALVVPRGIWGTIEERFGLRLLPVGYRLRRLGPGNGSNAEDTA